MIYMKKQHLHIWMCFVKTCKSILCVIKHVNGLVSIKRKYIMYMNHSFVLFMFQYPISWVDFVLRIKLYNYKTIIWTYNNSCSDIGFVGINWFHLFPGNVFTFIMTCKKTAAKNRREEKIMFNALIDMTRA